MNSITYLQNQLSNINAVYHSITDDLTEVEWVMRPMESLNMMGFIAWHIPRTQDTHVQTWIRGIAEVVHGERWINWRSLKRFGNGVGITLAESDEITQRVKRVDVLEYADAVYHEITAWLKELNENDLDQIPEFSNHLSIYPEYQTAGYVAESESLLNQPIWGQLMRPCIGHIHRHLGEMEVLKNIIRS